jgi:lipoate-protein ligase B
MIEALWFGRVPFIEGLRLQELLFQKIRTQITSNASHSHFLCLMEHSPVYTVGLRSQQYSQEEEHRLKLLGAEFHRIQRGGLITFHGPGQLVAYPLINLRSLHVSSANTEKTSVGVRRFVELVEETLIQLLTQEFGIPHVGRTEDTGVWVENDRKIAAIGIQVRHGVTSHGLALNCNTDLGWYEHIVPCGIPDKSVTSVSREVDGDVSVTKVLNPLCHFVEFVFQTPVKLRHCSASSLLNSVRE